MSGGLPKLNMGEVKDKEAKEKKTMAEKARKLGRQASAKLKRGLTPRGSRAEREHSFDSLDEALRPSDESSTLTGALGPQDYSQLGASDTESTGTPVSDSAPPLVQAPPADHEMLPQFEPASDAAKGNGGPTGVQAAPPPMADPAAKAQAASSKEASSSIEIQSAPAKIEDGGAAAAAPHTLAPPKHHEQLPQFEDADQVVAAAKAYAAKQEKTPDPQDGPDASEKQRPPASPKDSSRNKWKDFGIAVAVFALAAAAAEPAMNAWRRRKGPKTPAIDLKAAKKSSWGFA